jgi:Sulfotransferase family
MARRHFQQIVLLRKALYLHRYISGRANLLKQASDNKNNSGNSGMHKLRARDYQRTPIRLVNSALRILNSTGIARTTLDADQLMAAAKNRTGLDEFGDERFIEPLRRLVASTNKQTSINPLGRLLAKTNIQRLLDGRLRAQALWKKHPEILARKIPDPVVIVGLARSGTTRLHRLLASDDRFLHLKSWESVYPVPDEKSFQAKSQGQPEPRIKALDQALKAVLYMSPQVAAVHPLGTLEVEEEIGLLQYAFSTQLFEIINDVPDFAEWLMTHDQTFAYEYMAHLLKLISWFRGDDETKPWILKSPQHMQDLNALLHVFPNARLVCPHRDPIKVVGSSCSMAWNSLVRDNDAIDPHAVGQNWLHKTRRMLEKNLNERETLSPAGNQYDVLYSDITADWRQAMAGVYDFLDMPLTGRATDAMQAWLDSNQQHKHGSHKYTLEQFGLNKDQVDQHLMFYRERFSIPYETKNPHLASPPGAVTE